MVSMSHIGKVALKEALFGPTNRSNELTTTNETQQDQVTGTKSSKRLGRRYNILMAKMIGPATTQEQNIRKMR